MEAENDSKIRRILVLDGGGIKGAFTAAFLAELEKGLKEPLHRYFDLIVGTSTGGIIALGLGLGIPACTIFDMYQKEGKKIFPYRKNAAINCIRRICLYIKTALFNPSYPSEPLEQAIEKVLGDKTLGDSQNRLVIPAWHMESNDVYIYKTAHHERFETDWEEKAVDVAMATAAAPTYFTPFTNSNGQVFVDGGVFANNPANIATIEAISVLGWEPSQLRILSIAPPTPKPNIKSKGYKYLNIRQLMELVLYAQSQIALAGAKIITGHPHEGCRIHRCEPKVSHPEFTLDDASKVNRLKDLAKKIVREEKPKLKKIFFTETAEKFIPIYQSKEKQND